MKLDNRYNNEIFIEHIEDNLWQLQGDLEYCRMGVNPNDNTKIDFIDPPGGPFMQVDSFQINSDNNIYTLKEIKHSKDLGFLLTFE